MRELVLPATIFSDQPVWRDVVYNQDEIDEAEAMRNKLLASADEGDRQHGEAIAIPEPFVISFLLTPVTGDLDAEYIKRKGQNEQHLRFRPMKDGGDGEARIEFEPVDRVFSNERELAALKWIACKVIHGWKPFLTSDGARIEYSQHNLEKLCGAPMYIRPPVAEAYKMNDIRTDLEAGNSETSSGGRPTLGEDHAGDGTGTTIEAAHSGS